MVDESTTPALAGVHHLELPVRDLDRSRAWYCSRLGYRVQSEWVENGHLMGLGLHHPNGGPDLGGVKEFAELARQQLPRLYSLARQLVDDEAEDLVQSAS